MITTKEELKKYIKIDLSKYPSTKHFKSAFRKDFYYLIKRFLIILRKCEYYYNTHRNIRYLLMSKKKNKLGRVLNIEIPINVFDSGLTIYHPGIVVNAECHVGRNCKLHGNNCIGNKGSLDLGVPTIGDDCDLGFGSVVIGAIQIGDDCIVGANAVVTKSFPNRTTLVGNPAKTINKNE